jgi:hypothetical protein
MNASLLQMRHTPATLLAVLLLATVAVAQKKTTIIGDAWVGIVESTDEATREIKIVNPEKKTETFVGVLKEGYKVTLKDGTERELKVSELKPGLRVRVFYKSKTLDVAGQSKKVKLINRIDFLGRDDHTRVREMLKLPPSIPVSIEESGKLPNKNPLKLFVVSEMPDVAIRLATWADAWNNADGAKYGSVEIVDDAAQADVSLVIHWGSDETIVLVPMPIEINGRDRGEFTYGTTYLVNTDDKGLHVLWQRRTGFLLNDPGATAPYLGKELEKRLKARSK